MGRIDRFKGYDLLLKGFQSIHANHPDWYLVILGDGESRTEMEALSDQLGIRDRVFFLGLVKEPLPILSQCNLFVLASRYEGLPNVLLEAMSCGLPVVSTNCTGSIAEIVSDEVDGLLVPVEDIPALASAMDQIMEDGGLRRVMAQSAIHIVDRYGIEKIMNMWNTLICVDPGGTQ